MKKITITLEVNGNELSRKYNVHQDADELNWPDIISDMLLTIEYSNNEIK